MQDLKTTMFFSLIGLQFIFMLSLLNSYDGINKMENFQVLLCLMLSVMFTILWNIPFCANPIVTVALNFDKYWRNILSHCLVRTWLVGKWKWQEICIISKISLKGLMLDILLIVSLTTGELSGRWIIQIYTGNLMIYRIRSSGEWPLAILIIECSEISVEILRKMVSVSPRVSVVGNMTSNQLKKYPKIT